MLKLILPPPLPSSPLFHHSLLLCFLSSLYPPIHSLVLLLQLHSLNCRLPPLLSDWSSWLQLCMLRQHFYHLMSISFILLSLSISHPSNARIPRLHPSIQVLFPPFHPQTVLFLCYCLLIYDPVWLQFFKCFFFSFLCCGGLGVDCALLQAAVESIMKEKMPKKGGRWWFSWRGRNNSNKSVLSPALLMLRSLLSVSMVT